MGIERNCAIAALGVAVCLATAGQPALTPLDRDSTLNMNLANLDYIQGSTDTGDPIDLHETGLTSADDILIAGGLFYGPDGFDRVNSGTYSGLQDITIDAAEIAIDLTQESEVAGDANPSCEIDNALDLLFTVSESTGATLDFEFDGETNLGNDSVVLILRRVDTNDFVLETLFQLAQTGLDGSGSGAEAISLTAGERYRLIATGRARSLASTGRVLSSVSASITLDPAPCGDADLAEPFGVLDLADINAFVAGFTAQNADADLNDDGLWDLADINAFVGAFTAGCP